MRDKVIITTDLGELKAYRLTDDGVSSNPNLELIENFETVGANSKIKDLVTDMAGRFPVQGGLSHTRGGGTIATGAMSNGERHNMALEQEKRVLRYLSDSINRIVREQKVPYWFFAAPSEINQRLVDGLEPAAKAKLLKNVSADLIKTDKARLLTHFE